MSKIAFSGNAAGTATFTLAAPGTNTNRSISLPDTDGEIVTTESYPNVTRPLTLMTAQSTTSGTSKDFTGIPSWAKRVTVMFSGVSTNGTSNVQIQLGSGSVQTAGYLGSVVFGANAANFSSGFQVSQATAASNFRHGNLVLINHSSNIWTIGGTTGQSDGARCDSVGGAVTLSGTLDRIRITTVNGTDTFDAGSVNVMYEG